ncbi:MAG: hypothetical protein KGI49_00465 [Patescibacteria group bacterium]|nr:hypothetical protein [Patescibacteria group bacterium]
MKAIHYKHWTEIDKQMLEQTRTFKDLGRLALSIMSRFEHDIEMISGPYSTGGVGTREGNGIVFEGVIEIMILEKKRNIFSQMPFEEKIAELYKNWRMENPHTDYCMPILEDFYELVFSSGRVKVLNFIHDWQSSFGARWEHDGCSRWKIKRKYLTPDLSRRALELNQPKIHESAKTHR